MADITKSASALPTSTRFFGPRLRLDLAWTDVLPIFFIVLAQICIFLGYRIACVGFDALNLVIISLIVLRKDGERVELIQGLALVSILSLVSLSLPVFTTVRLLWLASIYTIMYVPLLLTVRYQKLSRRYVGLIINKATVYLVPLGILLGMALGVIEYRLLSALTIFTLQTSNLIVLSIVLLLFVAFVEELLFRSMLQQRFIERCGVIPGILITSAIFGLMHAGLANFVEVLYAGIVGVLLGVSFYKTKSLIFVTVINGVSNIAIFGLIPLGILHLI